MRICCIINGRSGTANKASGSFLIELFAKHGIKPQILEPEDGSSLAALAEEAAAQGYDIIVAGGGDGTINTVASALVGSKATKLGIIPTGTFNHFARALGIPVEIEKAVETVVNGQVKSVDVGEVNGRIFLNNSSLGLYPAMVKLRESLQKSGRSKLWAAMRASLRIFIRFRCLRLELFPAKGSALKRKTPMLFVGNNSYDTSLPALGTRPSLEQGQLWITMPTRSTRWGLISNLFSILSGREKAGDIITFAAANVTVGSRRRLLKVALDGEVLRLEPPLKYRTRKKSLRVIVPAARTDDHV